MNKQELVEYLYEEMRVAEDDIDDMGEVIDEMRMDIAFAKGRRCMACCLINELDEEN